MRKLTARSLALLLIGVSLSLAGELTGESRAVADALDKFHGALAHNDAKAAMALLAPDAVILEGGALETRAEYEAHHLPADIQFAQAVRSARSDIRVKIDGTTAWLTSRSHAQGAFEGKPIDSVGVELAVLTKTDEGWRIRAIHWSSHRISSGK
ncbi:MAG: nuclear transport factor 2 family protein [Verrucomicrobiota bacterium]|nr:nuclear transport factor 2 family protein [Verrucomicrobiota bacterium]